jgi:hypothetical protein
VSEEFKSRHNLRIPRWGDNDAGTVQSVHVTEPSGGVKDTGWIPGPVNAGGTGIVGPWWNWLHYMAGQFFRYLDLRAALLWTRPSLMPGSAAGECAVTIGAGMSVNVATGRVMILGGMHSVPAVVGLALDPAHATLSRIDLVVARIVAAVPTYAVISGTPGATPAPPLPLFGDVVLAQAFVLPAAGAPFLILDLREFGALDIDAIRVTRNLYAGQVTPGAPYLLDVDARVEKRVRLGSSTDPQLEVDANNGRINVKADQFRTFEDVVGYYDITPGDFQDLFGFGGEVGVGPINHTYGAQIGDGQAIAPIRLPPNSTIRAWRVYGAKGGTDNVSASLITKVKATNAAGMIGVTRSTDALGNGSGAFVLVNSGLSIAYDPAKIYELLVDFHDAGTDLEIFAAEVEYTVRNPLKGIT